MDSPTTRVLALLELLQSFDEISGPELARRLNVDARTLRRYITRLQALGISVVSDRGRYGAYRLSAGVKLPPLMFSDEEAVAVSIGLLFADQLVGVVGGTISVQSARSKLSASCQPNCASACAPCLSRYSWMYPNPSTVCPARPCCV